MTSTAPSPGALRRAEQAGARRDELAQSALLTLGERGYARTSLRDIAQNSPYTHGVVHYYFKDKLELVLYSIRYYKARCVTRYDAVVADATSADDLVDRFSARLCETIRDEAAMHRLWYDVRTQSMFESELRDAVAQIDNALQDMIWRIVSRYAELAGRLPSVSPATAYGMLDGVFQLALLGYHESGEPALADLSTQVRSLMPALLAPGAREG